MYGWRMSQRGRGSELEVCFEDHVHKNYMSAYGAGRRIKLSHLAPHHAGDSSGCARSGHTIPTKRVAFGLSPSIRRIGWQRSERGSASTGRPGRIRKPRAMPRSQESSVSRRRFSRAALSSKQNVAGSSPVSRSRKSPYHNGRQNGLACARPFCCVSINVAILWPLLGAHCDDLAIRRCDYSSRAKPAHRQD